MAKLSSAAWMVHDLGLATAIGGTLFGQQALHPALNERVEDEQARMLVADAAWRKFSWLNLVAHGAFAATWFIGRSMLTGREVSRTSRTLTQVKDVLVVASLVTGVTSVVLGRILGKKARAQGRVMDPRARQGIATLRRTVGILGLINLGMTASVAAVTTALSMEASKSLPFSYVSRRLP